MSRDHTGWAIATMDDGIVHRTRTLTEAREWVSYRLTDARTRYVTQGLYETFNGKPTYWIVRSELAKRHGFIEWTTPDEEVDCIVVPGQRCTHMACQATEDQNRHEG